jgi:hypothetical protein
VGGGIIIGDGKNISLYLCQSGVEGGDDSRLGDGDNLSGEEVRRT